LLSAEFRALGDLLRLPSRAPRALQVIMDLRRYLPSGRGTAVANLAGALFPVPEWTPEAPFEKTLSLARDAMNAFKAHAPGLGGALYWQMGARITGFGRLERLIQRGVAEGVETG
jgi:NRPS condensation-like uncharacterized protein